METIKQYVREQICLPPATIIQRWSEYMDAEAKLLSQHRAADAKLLAEHVSAQSSLLDQHLNARAVLLSSFTGQVNRQEPRIRLVDDGREVLGGYLEYISGVLDSAHKSIVAQNNLPIEVVVLIVLAGYIVIPCPTRTHSYRTRPTISPPSLRPTKFRQTITAHIRVPLTRWYTSIFTPHGLSTAALSASSLLTAFATTSLPPDGRFSPLQKQRLDAALVALLTIRANVSGRYNVQGEELTVDAGCVICYAEVVDTVLMPCSHMVVYVLWEAGSWDGGGGEVSGL
ncbi:hypothetical protein Q9L58_002257 [Maublancomyces gigas]|uniref:Uncharacterized protein n=1 Tax=Discina gigas TaxID=1032678 RepID=A0ABR3GRW5_9PEZI